MCEVTMAKRTRREKKYIKEHVQLICVQFMVVLHQFT